MISNGKKSEILIFEKSSGCRYLKDLETDVEIPITDAERLEISRGQSKCMVEARKARSELKDISDQLKTRIADLETNANTLAHIINHGKKTSKKDLPCFYDHESKNRIVVDLDRGEIVAQLPAMPEDAQLSI